MFANQFPKNFLWGTATAAHQVEGNNIHSDWWDWEISSSRTPNSGKACDHYNLYKKDFDLIKNTLHNNAHRLSIEWARIEPEENKIDEDSIKHYSDVFTELKKRGIKIMLTLNHFTLPLWFMKKGGWEKRENLKYFERFTELVAKEYGSDIDYWCIINEPNVYTASSYLTGFWTPKKKNIFSAIKVYLNLARAHKSVYRIIHNIVPNSIVGSSINMTYYKGNNLIEKIIAKIASHITNNTFISLSKNYDYIGINSYFYIPIRLSRLSAFEHLSNSQLFTSMNGDGDLGWYDYHQSIYHVCKDTWNRYKIPIMITENGIADKYDAKRPKYILDNLTWLLAAINEGVDIRGYFHWSLMDNFEWSFGKKVKFGLFETNFETFERIPRKSALLYGQICKNNSIAVLQGGS